MLILDKLWRGDVAPGERRYRPNREYGKHLQKIEKCEGTIKAELSDVGKIAFVEYVDAETAVRTMSECDSFIAGFRTAVMIMLDVFYPADGKEDVRV